MFKKAFFKSQPMNYSLCGQELSTRINSRAKYLRIGYNSRTKQFSLTLPPWAKQKDIESFLQKALPWVEGKAKKQQHHETIELTHGVFVPILGQACRIHFQKDIKKSVSFTQDQITVSHPRDDYLPLLTAGIKDQALRILKEKSYLFAETLDVTIKKISVKDTYSRWGSCSPDGSLSYSWRLIFAPAEVAHYVCAHEVAHLLHMNHSKDFWRVVASLCPNYQRHRGWLKTNGQQLFMYKL